MCLKLNLVSTLYVWTCCALKNGPPTWKILRWRCNLDKQIKGPWWRQPGLAGEHLWKEIKYRARNTDPSTIHLLHICIICIYNHIQHYLNNIQIWIFHIWYCACFEVQAVFHASWRNGCHGRVGPCTFRVHRGHAVPDACLSRQRAAAAQKDMVEAAPCNLEKNQRERWGIHSWADLHQEDNAGSETCVVRSADDLWVLDLIPGGLWSLLDYPRLLDSLASGKHFLGDLSSC